MGSRVAWLLVGAVLGSTLWGCAGKSGATKADSAANADSNDIRPQRQANEKLTEFDLNHDQKADVWSYTVASKGPDGKEMDKLVRKELDINWDGKVDITKYYSDNEQVERESLDLDFDGKVDQINHYEKGAIVRKERDLDYNSKPDLWVYYEKGKLERKERDTNGDGKVDYWEYWEGEQVDRIGEDLDGDGNVDRWTKNPNGEAQ